MGSDYGIGIIDPVSVSIPKVKNAELIPQSLYCSANRGTGTLWQHPLPI
jgi:hypothetical protein